MLGPVSLTLPVKAAGYTHLAPNITFDSHYTHFNFGYEIIQTLVIYALSEYEEEQR